MSNPESTTTNLQFGQKIVRRIGKYFVAGKFIGMHPVKGRNIPFIESERMQVASDNKYNHKALETERNRFSLAVSHIKQMIREELTNENHT